MQIYIGQCRRDTTKKKKVKGKMRKVEQEREGGNECKGREGEETRKRGRRE